MIIPRGRINGWQKKCNLPNWLDYATTGVTKESISQVTQYMLKSDESVKFTQAFHHFYASVSSPLCHMLKTWGTGKKANVSNFFGIFIKLYHGSTGESLNFDYWPHLITDSPASFSALHYQWVCGVFTCMFLRTLLGKALHFVEDWDVVIVQNFWHLWSWMTVVYYLGLCLGWVSR